MIKNIIVYICILFAAFVFSIFYYAWFSWYLLLCILSLPVLSLLVSLPFMIITALNGINLNFAGSNNDSSDCLIAISGKKHTAIVCPLIRIKIKAYNSFANINYKGTLFCAGRISEQTLLIQKKLCNHCGRVAVNIKSCRVYDLMGIFFIPIKTNKCFNFNVMPQNDNCDIAPSFDENTIIGYKPKSGGIADFYELAEYQHGDSIRSVHWKLSSKLDKLIVRKPYEPVYSQPAIRLELTDSCKENDKILARFLFACLTLLESGRSFYVLCRKTNGISHIKSKRDVMCFIDALYRGDVYNKTSPDETELAVYVVGFEEVHS